MTHPGFFCSTVIVVMIGGAADVVSAAFIPRQPDMRWTIAGFVVMVLAAAIGVLVRTTINAALLEYARQAGYDVGFQDGLTIEPVAVTRLHRVS